MAHRAVWNEDGTYNFEEMCPLCGNFIPIEIDYSEFNCYELDCPACGYRMMLCTLCKWDQEEEDDFDGNYKCDWSEETGCYRKQVKDIE